MCLAEPGCGPGLSLPLEVGYYTIPGDHASFCWPSEDWCPFFRAVCPKIYQTSAYNSLLCTLYRGIFKCLPGLNGHFLGNLTLLFVLFPIILVATVSLLKIIPHMPSRTNYTSNYSGNVSFSLLSWYPEQNIRTE